ncbi:MAG TPA: hypothetical protein VGH42_04890 [Verrucomicrobiae bacterium]|jgi:hypothetical protein
MKKKILSICLWISTAFFVVFAGLYIYVLIADPKTHIDDSGIHWPNITIKHNPPTIITNPPSKISAKYPLYKPITIDDPSIHVAVTKDDWNGNLMFFNQRSPYVGGTLIMTGGHDSTNHVDRISEKGWDGFGIYFCLIEDVRRPDSWWTFRINLWYLIILFGILPAIFAVKKLRNRKSASTKKATVEK